MAKRQFDLLEGTLDLLVLKSLALVRCMGWAFQVASHRSRSSHEETQSCR
jgi:hypothetical protein